MAFSSIGAEIPAAETSTEHGSLTAESLKQVYKSEVGLLFALKVDSHSLYSTVTTLHEGTDYILRPTVARMRDFFENGELAKMQWIAGKQNLADALKKRNLEMFRKLNEVKLNGVRDLFIIYKMKRICGIIANSIWDLIKYCRVRTLWCAAYPLTVSPSG